MSRIFEFPFLGENKVLSSETRAGLPGEFIQCTDGITHYQLEGIKEGPLVVMVHGFSTPSFIWDPTYKALLSFGFRVLRYDLFGRGLSDRPHLPNTLDFFERQLIDLLAALEIEEKFFLLGLSMGAIISANFAAKHLNRVSKLALFDPAGVVPIKIPNLLKFALLPISGEILLSLVGNKRIEKYMLNDFYNLKDITEVLEKVRLQMQYKGYKRSLLSTVRSGMLNAEVSSYRKIGECDLPVLLVWGREDAVVPFEHSDRLLSMIPQIEFHPITDSGHIPHYDKADIVNPILIEFLKR